MRASIVALLAGCGRIAFAPSDAAPDPTADTATDMPIDAPPCTWGPWGTPDQIFGLSGVDPMQRGDRLQAWTAEFIASLQFDIFTASRTVPTGVFGAQVEETGINDPGSSDQDPSVTADGLHMLFVSNRTGIYHLYESSRTTATALLGTPSLALGLETLVIGSADLLPDGLTAYVDLDFSSNLFRTRRTSLTAPFDAPVLAAASCSAFPSVSTDERELFYARSGTMYTRSRATTADAFGPEVTMTLATMGGDPEVSVDGTELWFTDSGVPMRSTRTCN